MGKIRLGLVQLLFDGIRTAWRDIRSVECLLVTSAEEGGYVFGAVCLSVCPSDYSQTCERILTKFFGGVGHGSRAK